MAWFPGAEALHQFGIEMTVKLVGVVLVAAAGFMAVLAAAIPLVSDFAMMIACMFLPLCLAFWPLTKSWALSAINTAMCAAMTGPAAAFFISIMFNPTGGLLKKAIDEATGVMTAGGGVLEPILGAMIGMICIYFLGMFVLMSIPSMVSSIFGGVSLNGALAAMAGASAAGAAVGAAAKAGTMGAIGASMGAKAAAGGLSPGGSKMSAASAIIGGAMKGGAAGAMPKTTRALGALAGAAKKGGGPPPPPPPGGGKGKGKDGSTGI